MFEILHGNRRFEIGDFALFMSTNHTFLLQVLLGAAVDSWDRVREGAYSLLMAYPAPLPGLEQPAQVQSVYVFVSRVQRPYTMLCRV